MIYPKFIKKGSKIAVPAPSAGAYNELYNKRFDNAKKKLEKMGYIIELSKNIYNSNKARSASKDERAKEINDIFEDAEIDAIICAAGGEFLMEILDDVNFEKLVKEPKWVQGFSNPTTIIYPITTLYDIATIYSNNFSSFGAEEYHKSIIDNLELLKGNLLNFSNYELYEEEGKEKITGLEGYNLTKKVEWKILNADNVKIKGRLLGGCLEDIVLISGTKYDGINKFNERYKNDGTILYFDNCESSKEELIRSLWKLKQLGYFKYANGIIFGRNGIEKSWIGYSMEEALKDSCLYGLNIPIIYDADISHKGPTMPLINGAIGKIEINNNKALIKLELI